MSVHLLDVNVLIALLDPDHVQHDRAHDWFAHHGTAGWATCPITEAGVLRILGNPRYPNARGGPGVILPYLEALCSLPGHVFWPDDLSLRDTNVFRPDRLLDFGQVTDSYLLAMAVKRKGWLTTFDRRLVPDSVSGGQDHLDIIG